MRSRVNCLLKYTCSKIGIKQVVKAEKVTSDRVFWTCFILSLTTYFDKHVIFYFTRLRLFYFCLFDFYDYFLSSDINLAFWLNFLQFKITLYNQLNITEYNDTSIESCPLNTVDLDCKETTKSLNTCVLSAFIMAGRGRGGRGLSFNIDALGFGRGDALPQAINQPPPLFPVSFIKKNVIYLSLVTFRLY